MTQNWIYIDPVHPEDWFGFVYVIKNKVTGRIYVGKKVFWNNLKKKLTKTELAEQPGPGRKPTHKRVTKESNWLTYWGSNKELLEDVKELGQDNFERKILKLCKSKKELTYYELHYQCKEEVLLTNSYNDNILGKFYRRDLLSED
jgi:hypothetical protein